MDYLNLKVGQVVKIRHGGIPEGVKVKILSKPKQRIRGRQGYSVSVEYLDIPDRLVGLLDMDQVTYVGCQENIQDAQLELVTGVALSNEHILAVFLKRYKKFASFKRCLIDQDTNLDCYIGSKGITEVENVILEGFFWEDSENGHDTWCDLDDKWHLLVGDFKIVGTIHMKKLMKIK